LIKLRSFDAVTRSETSPLDPESKWCVVCVRQGIQALHHFEGRPVTVLNDSGLVAEQLKNNGLWWPTSRDHDNVREWMFRKSAGKENGQS
jgi:hypothetical protein